MKGLFRRSSTLDSARAGGPVEASSSPPPNSVAGPTALTEAEEEEEGGMGFANRDGQTGRSMPAHLRSAFATVPSSGPAFTPRADPGLRPSERFARREEAFVAPDGVADSEMPLLRQQAPQRSLSSATNGPPSVPPKQEAAKLQKPSGSGASSAAAGGRKTSFFSSLGQKKSKLPPFMSGSTEDRYESRSLPAARTNGAALEGGDASREKVAVTSADMARTSSDRSDPPPTHLLAGYTSPPGTSIYAAGVQPALPQLSLPVSQALGNVDAPASTASGPRSTPQSSSSGYSPFASFFGTSAPASSSHTASSYHSPLTRPSDAGTVSPTSLSDADTIPSGSIPMDSPFANSSTPATSDGGHAEPTKKPSLGMAVGGMSTNLEDLLSRYAPRPIQSQFSATETPAPVSSAAPVPSSAGFAAPVMTSYLYSGITSSTATPPLVSKSSEAPAPFFSTKTGFASSRTIPRPAWSQAPESSDGTAPIQHSSSITSQETVVEPQATLTSSTSDAFLSGTAASPTRTYISPWSMVSSSMPFPSSTSKVSEVAPSSSPASQERLQSPFATNASSSSQVERKQVELAQPRPVNGLLAPFATSGRNTGSTPVIETTPDIEPFAVTSPALNASAELPIEGNMSRLSVAAREARDRLASLHGELESARASPRPSVDRSSQSLSSQSVLAVSSSNSGPSSVDMAVGGSDGDVSGFDDSSRISSIEVPRLLICFGNPRMEHALSKYPQTILWRLVSMMEWVDLRALREVSRTLRSAFERDETREYILERYLGKYGYRTMTSSDRANGRPIDMSLRDLEAFLTGREFAPAEFAELAREHMRNPLDYVTVRMLNSAMRAWNRLVMRCRSQGPPFTRPSPGVPAVFKDGRAACLRVWVPLRDGHWMQDDEVVQCEKEVWRAGVWSMVQKGDVVWNLAQGDFANEGKLISDSKFLRDLMYVYDHVGHLPNWLNGMTFSPGFWHNVLSASDQNHPVFYASLMPWAQQLKDSMILCKENVAMNQNTGRYRIQRYVYRAHAELKAGTLIGIAGSDSGNGPGGIDCIHQDWTGHLYVETEGSTEHAQELVQRCSSSELLPFRVLREKSRPGKIVIRPVLESERIS